MNKQTIALLRSSFAEVARRRPDVAAVFYKRLFEVAPSVKPMFKSSPKDQQRKLTAALAQIVATVDQPEKLASHLQRLGKRHQEYGAQPAHYKVVGDVLLWTFGQVLGRDFTAPTRAAWADAYAIVAQSMIAAAEQSSAPQKKAPAASSKPKPGVRRVKRAATAAAVSGKRKAARKPVGRTPKRAR